MLTAAEREALRLLRDRLVREQLRISVRRSRSRCIGCGCLLDASTPGCERRLARHDARRRRDGVRQVAS